MRAAGQTEAELREEKGFLPHWQVLAAKVFAVPDCDHVDGGSPPGLILGQAVEVFLPRCCDLGF